LRKQELLITDVKERNISIEYFKQTYKLLPLNSNKHFKILLELQNFKADSDQIWAAKFSHDNKFLATGGTTKVLKIWEIYTYEHSLENYEGDFREFLPFLYETAYRIYTEHSDSIIDLAWSYNDNNVLYTASLDHYIIMWNINELSCVKKFEHISMLFSISIDPNVLEI
jgi:WD40 repeat protein